MMSEVFGHLSDGQAVHRLRLQGGGLTAHVLTLGAIVQDLRLDGIAHPLVLGADSLTPYLGPMQYFGAIVGRCANRIAKGRFEIDGQIFQASTNFRGRHCLHGGTVGSGQKIWAITAQTLSTVVMSLQLPDGDMGFPGALNVVLTISLADTTLDFDIRATCERSTLCNFAHHGYFILDDSGSIASHSLRLAADHFLPVDDDLIPTGEVAPVAQTDFDFCTDRNLRNVALDHNFCLSQERTTLRPVAWLETASVSMRMDTTEPGLQLYTANHLPQPGIHGPEGRAYGRHAGIAMEAQVWPDAPNHPNFPSALLRPGDVYHQHTRYVFKHVPDPEPLQ